MEDWNAQKMLDLYIHDYLVRKNMHTTADILAEETGMELKTVAINPPEGFLSEWWTIFWDAYSSRDPNNPQAPGAQGSPSSSQAQALALAPAPVNDGTLPENVLSVPDMLHNICPTTPGAGLPNLPMPDMGSFLQTSIPPMPTQDQLMALLISQRAREQEHQRLPPRNFDANPNVLAGSSSRRQRKTNSRRQHLISNDAISGPGARRTTPPEPTHAPRLTQEDLRHIDAGTGIFEQNPSEGCSFPVLGYADNLLGSDQQPLYSVPSAGSQDDIFAELAAQESQKLAMCAPESSTKKATHIYCNDGSKKKGVQIEESRKSKDDGDASGSMGMTSARKREQLQDFPFGLVRSIQPSDNKLSCCDFSSQGKFLAAAGHEKKVFIWNVKQSTGNAIPIEAHSEIITDVRFKANSFMFATSSYDKTVKIWDATNTKRLLHNLSGHAGQVMSVDFHPNKTNIVCSCDSNGDIKYWHVKESICFRDIKGGNTQVRFQSRHGKFLAAATGNVINLIDVETGTIQLRFEGHEEAVRTIGWDVCGDFLVSASEDSTRMWSINSGGRCIKQLASTARDFASSTFHPAYSQVVVIGGYQSIYIWNPIAGNRTWKFNAHQGIIPAVAHAPETNMIASVSDDHCVKLWK